MELIGQQFDVPPNTTLEPTEARLPDRRLYSLPGLAEHVEAFDPQGPRCTVLTVDPLRVCSTHPISQHIKPPLRRPAVSFVTPDKLSAAVSGLTTILARAFTAASQRRVRPFVDHPWKSAK